MQAKNTPPLVSIIIPTYNAKDLLANCLTSLSCLDYKNYETIIVDNGSTDGTPQFLSENFSNIKIIENNKNVGFAGACNIGYTHAHGDYILLLNNDTTVESNLLTEMVKLLEKDKTVGACQPKIMLMDQPEYFDSLGSYLSIYGFLIHHGLREKDCGQYDYEAEIFSTKGTCMLIRRSIIENVGLFDTDFFAYFEETDLCWRIWLAGYRVLYTPKTRILHKVGATSTKMDSSIFDFHGFKNRIASIIKNTGTRNLLIMLPLHILLTLCIMVYFIFRLRPKRSIDILRALMWNAKNIRMLMAKRRFIQKNIRKVKDDALTPKIMRKKSILYLISLAKV